MANLFGAHGKQVTHTIEYPAQEPLVVKVDISEFDGIKLGMKYEIRNKETGKVLGIGETKHCFTNSNMRPISLKKVNKEFYDIFEKYAK